jgi:lipopolysaccharide export system permease protein
MKLRMSLLDRYIMAHIFGLSAIVALALTAIYTFVSFVSEIGDVGEGNYGVPQLIGYVLWLMPSSLYVLLPIIAMLGTLTGLGTLAGQSEIIAMRAAGVSLAQIGRSTVYAGLLIGLFSLVLGDWLAPYGRQSAEALRSESREGTIAAAVVRQVWLREGENILHIRQLLAEDHIAGIEIFSLSPDLGLSSVLRADEGWYRNGRWQLEDVRRTEFNDASTQATESATLDWGPQPTPEVMRLFVLKANAISIRGLMQLMSYLRANDLDDRGYALELWRKLMTPLTVVAMMLFAVPFIMGPLRNTGAGQRLLVGVLIGVAFYVVNEVSANTGQLYGWSPMASAGAPTLALALAAFWRLRRLT